MVKVVKLHLEEHTLCVGHSWTLQRFSHPLNFSCVMLHLETTVNLIGIFVLDQDEGMQYYEMKGK